MWREELGWSRQDELLAVISETVDLWGRRWMRASGAKQHDLPAPIQITRPGQPEQAPKKVTSDPGEIRRFFKQHISRR